jgi:hypothetical protein
MIKWKLKTQEEMKEIRNEETKKIRMEVKKKYMYMPG